MMDKKLRMVTAKSAIYFECPYCDAHNYNMDSLEMDDKIMGVDSDVIQCDICCKDVKVIRDNGFS